MRTRLPQACPICTVCGETYTGYGHNALPVRNGRCCDDCNTLHVIPKRLRLLQPYDGKDPYEYPSGTTFYSDGRIELPEEEE